MEYVLVVLGAQKKYLVALGSCGQSKPSMLMIMELQIFQHRASLYSAYLLVIHIHILIYQNFIACEDMVFQMHFVHVKIWACKCACVF